MARNVLSRVTRRREFIAAGVSVVILALSPSFVGADGGAATSPATSKPAGLELSGIFTDHMVLQREKPIVIWGWCAPGQTVTVELADNKASAVAGEDGRWVATLGAMKAGGPYEVRVVGKETITLSDVLIGDVWIAGGQSNMGMRMESILKDLAKEKLSDGGRTEADIADANNFPRLRLCRIHTQHVGNAEPQTRLPSGGGARDWHVCDAQSAAKFSAAAFYFARELQRELNVPIGVIDNSHGGTPIEVWISEPSLEGLFKTIPGLADRCRTMAKQEEETVARRLYRKANSRKSHERAKAHEKDANAAAAIAAPRLDDSAWGSIELPAMWEKTGIEELAEFNGFVWFRKTVDIPESWAGQDVRIELGRTVHLDAAWFDGQPLGAIGSIDPPDGGHPASDKPENKPSVYDVSGKLVTAGRHVIAVRVFNFEYDGGFQASAAQMRLKVAQGEQTPIPLAGTWKYQLGPEFVPPWHEWLFPTRPASLFNTNVNSIRGLAIRGFLWYQGESNIKALAPWTYGVFMRALISDWRAAFNDDSLPFYYVQLPNIALRGMPPGDLMWQFREAQASVLDVPHTGMAVTIDVGDDGHRGHPLNKAPVGRRLALLALARTYGRDVIDRGPSFAGMNIEGDKAIVRFDNVADGLKSADGKPLRFFQVAGADGKFVDATAEIQGKTVVVSSPAVKAPVAVRYAFLDNPLGINFYNSADLPAEPFRTDVPKETK